MTDFYIEEGNLSVAWAKAFLNTIDVPGGEINPLIVKVTGFYKDKIMEDSRIRKLINESDAINTIKKKTKISKDYIETVAGTIFSQSQWNKNKSRAVLFDRYCKTYPLIKKTNANKYGTYFHRLIAFNNCDNKPVNQLEHIIQAYEKGCHRRSALQAAIFDPRKDHSNSKRRGFPCLQQIAFSPLGTNGKKGLRITGFYATQLIFEKAYGNYLGLCRLGYFMAKEMGLKLKEMVCIANVGSFSKLPKKDFQSFKNELEKLL